jgi:hypothetical protein
VLVAAARSRARQLARSLRRVPVRGLSGDAELAAGPPRRSAPARQAAGVAQAAPRASMPLVAGASSGLSELMIQSSWRGLLTLAFPMIGEYLGEEVACGCE